MAGRTKDSKILIRLSGYSWQQQLEDSRIEVNETLIQE